MQIIFKNKNEKCNNRETDIIDIIICAERISRCIKEKYIGIFRDKKVEFKLAEEFLLELRKEFREGDEKAIKVAELKRVEQGRRTIKEFVQKFRRAVRESRYKERTLVKKFKRGMSGVIRKKLIKVERPPSNIE